MHIIVTGGTGLIGSRLVPELIKRGHHVTELRRYHSGRGLAHSGLHEIVWYDMRGGGTIPLQLRTPDLVIHLAAMASNTVANQNPVECFDIIATGTQRLIEDLRGDLVFILASSSEVIGNEHGGVFAHNPYAAAKIAAEEAVRASGYRWITARPFNTYGRALVGEPVAVIDKWIVAALRGYPLERWPNSPVRDFLWREDHVRAYLAMVEQVEQDPDPLLEQPFQFGTGIGYEVNTVLPMVAERLGAEIIDVDSARGNDTPYLVANVEPAMTFLGWAAEVGLEEGIDRAIEEWRWKLSMQTRPEPSATS